MASIRNNAGDQISKTQLIALLTAVPQPNKYTVNENIFRLFRTPGVAADSESQRELLLHVGQTITQKQLDDLFPAGTFLSITPATGPIAGGTVVTIKGTNLGGASGVTFGGVAGTDFDVVDEDTIKVTTPATTAGAKNVVIADDSGAFGAIGAYTYV